MSAILESEKKRLQSVKEKKQAFKTKNQFIQQALSNLDKPKNNKIIFDDDNISEVKNTESIKAKKKKIDLFDGDDNDDNNNKDDLWNEDEFNANKPKKIVLGNDTRFTLDNRFVEDDCTIEKPKVEIDTDKCDLQKEKEKQLDILESILGPSFPTKNHEKSTKKGLMIRYDPTENEHCEYEMKPAPKTDEKNTKKKKHDKLIPKTEESVPIKVSQEIYHNVTDALIESLKQKEKFSFQNLLKTDEKDNDKGYENNDLSIAENKDTRFKFNFNTNNIFKDNDADEAFDTDKQIIEETPVNRNTCNLFSQKNTLFFNKDDIRFDEAVQFFNTDAASQDEFKNLRRELKMIVRTKIRRNENRHQPWNKKRKIKKFTK